MAEPTQLERLAKPFPKRLIHENPSGGGSYVKHSVVTEKLLAVLGPFSFELVEVLRGQVAGIAPNAQGKSERARKGSPPLDGAVVGVVCRLLASVDGVPVHIDEVGDCESPHNWPHDGARLKDAMSDALKRCAMRLGVTLHLWSGAEFSLYEQLRTDENAGGGQGAIPPSAGSNPVASAPPATSPAGTDLEHSTAANGGAGSPAAPPTSKARRERLKSRCVALQADGVSIADAREELGLPLVDSCDEEQLTRFEAMVDNLEAALAAPFVEVDA